MSRMQDPHDRYAAAARDYHDAARRMVDAASDMAAADLAGLLDDAGVAARAVTVHIEWVDLESTRETVTSIVGRSGDDLTRSSSPQDGFSDLAEWLSDRFIDSDGRTYLADSVRESGDLPLDLDLVLPPAPTPASVR